MACVECLEWQQLRKHQRLPFLGTCPWQVRCWALRDCDLLKSPSHLGVVRPIAATEVQNSVRKYEHLRFCACWCQKLQGPAPRPCGLQIPSAASAYTKAKLQNKLHAPEHSASFLKTFLNSLCFLIRGWAQYFQSLLLSLETGKDRGYCLVNKWLNYCFWTVKVHYLLGKYIQWQKEKWQIIS